ncbi:acyl-protein synthetase [Xylaria sp. FL1042]|nr:acyl-protein synthetase [Xylaria sp. FL1042]
MGAWSCLQDVLRDRAESGSIKYYPLGDVTEPLTVTYKELLFAAQKNSTMILKIPEFTEKQPVLLYFASHIDNIVWFWSLLFAGGVPVILSPSHVSPDQVKGLVSLMGNPICLTTCELTGVFNTGHGLQLHTVEDVLCQTPTSSMTNHEDHYEGGSAIATLMLTSGSTGNSKAVSLSHDQIFAAVAGKAAVRPVQLGNFPLLNWIGLDHVASLIEIHIQALWLGVDQIHVHAADVVSSPTIFLSLLHRHKVSRTFAPNFFLAKIVTAVQSEESIPDQDRQNWDLSNLSILASGGEENSLDICIAAASILYKYKAPKNVIIPGFGMTETCAGAIFNLECPEYDVRRGGIVASVGTCMDGIEMRITVPGENIQVANTNEVGDLEVRGSVVFRSYYRDPKSTTDAFTPDGWFRTGDQGTVDTQGCLTLSGRVKDVVNINGAKFSMASIQTALDRLLFQRTVRLIAFASRIAHTEQLTVVYVSNDVEDILEIEELATQACYLQVGASPLIFSLRKESIPLLPTSSLGKISRAKMRTLYESGAFSEDLDLHLNRVRKLREQTYMHDGRAANNTEATIIGVLRQLRRVGTYTISINTSIFELGFSSIDIIRLKLNIDRKLRTSVPVTTLMRHPTPSSLAKALSLNRNETSLSSGIVSVYDPVVVFNASGSKTPLWLVHPGIGEVLVFVGLAQHLAINDRPVYALRARGFEPGHERFKSIDEAIELYIAAIRQRQPLGPYAIAGYSYGTMLAFEMTKKLEAEDGSGTVQFLGSLNLPPHIKTRMRQLTWNNCLLHLAYFLGLTSEENAEQIEESDFQKLDREKALVYIFEIADQSRMGELGLDKPGLIRWTDVAYDLPRMATDYDPKGDVAVLDIFHAIPLKAAAPNREEWVKVHLNEWRRFCRSEPRFHKVGGAHYTMIGPDHVATFSATLLSALDARGV